MLRAAFVLFCVLFSSAGHAEKRTGLVIGNSAYRFASELANPKNDAGDMSAALKKLGFQVIDGIDLDKAGMERRLREFARALTGSDVGLLFYAGHGIQVAGQNYLVPIDAKLEDASGIDFELVRLDLVQRTMEREARTNILFLDACRDNPLARNLARAMGTRSGSIGRGLAQVEAGGGTLISYSTQPGNVALDGTGRNSPFAGALIRNIDTPGADLGATLIKVRREVMQETQNRQVPWEHSALIDTFYFNVTINISPAPAGPPASEAERAWLLVKDTTDPAILAEFTKRYEGTFFATLAQARIDELKKRQAAAAAPPAAPPSRASSYGQPAPPETAATRVVGFTYRTPPQEIDPGLRVFKREADDTWSNTYPSGHVDRGGRVRARVIVDGCNGTVIGKDTEPDFAVFIPDKGCPGMMARWRRGTGHWNVLGPMQNVR